MASRRLTVSQMPNINSNKKKLYHLRSTMLDLIKSQEEDSEKSVSETPNSESDFSDSESINHSHMHSVTGTFRLAKKKENALNSLIEEDSVESSPSGSRVKFDVNKDFAISSKPSEKKLPSHRHKPKLSDDDPDDKHCGFTQHSRFY